MVKITFVIPYDDIKTEVYDLIKQVNEEGIVFETINIIGTNEVLEREFNSDIIIARGVTYRSIKKNKKRTSVVEIAVTGYDVIRAINECKKRFNPQRVAIIGSETMIYGADTLSEIMGVDISTFKIENEEEAINALKRAKEENCDATVSGLMTYKIAKDIGLNCTWIKTGKEAIRQAIKEAINAANVTRVEREKAQLFKTVLESTKEGIIAVDEDGNITTFNRQAYNTLRIPKNRNLMGKPIKKVIPKFDIHKVIETGEEELGIIDTFNEVMIVSNRTPIRLGDSNVGVVMTIENVDTIQAIESKIRKELSNKGLTAKYSFGNIIGKSKELNRTIQTAYKYSQVDSNILIVGETGVGKELFAQSIHNASKRNIKPFVAVNCAALPENLLESELFGYVEGAFSGAMKGGKIGLFELAHKGTIFLDEVGEISSNLQAKLLRVLQEREIRRIGDNKVVPIDVRIISATNINIKEKVKSGEFREDLLYRLDVLNLKIPSLRERKEDIKHVCENFIKEYADKFNKPMPKLTFGAISLLNKYHWPGNIRQMKNICERLVVLTEKDIITEEDVLSQIDFGNEVAKNNEIDNCTNNKFNKAQDSIDNLEMEIIKRVMESVQFNKTEAAKVLGISRTTLWRKLNSKN